MKYGKLVNNILVEFTPYKNGLKLNNHIIYNPTKEQYIEAGWYPIEEVWDNGNDNIQNNILYHYIGYAEALKLTIDKKLAEIDTYDTSDAVNSFIYNGLELWIPRETRVSLQNSTAILLKHGIEVTNLWYLDFHFELPCTAFLEILDAIEIYALQCFNKTAEHKVNVKHLTSIKAVNNYDYTLGYPEKLNINV